MKQLFFGLFLTAAALSAQQNVDNGKKLYNEYTCYGCHGFSGQNGPGNRLVSMKMSQIAFTAYVRNPPNPNRMPSYSAKVLTDAQMGDIWNYIKTLPDAPPAKDIKLLQDLKNELK